MSPTLSDLSSRPRVGRRGVYLSLLAVALIASAATLGVSSRAAAFTNPSEYSKYSTQDLSSLGGGAGRYFTGSPADAYTCEVCHSSPSSYSFPLVQKGLPLDGYVPRRSYKIELSSPLALAATQQALSQGLKPVTTLTAEFIAADGGPAGTVSFANDAEISSTAFPGLWCSTLASAQPDKILEEYGMNIYAQDTGSYSVELTAATTDRLGDSCSVGKGKDEEGEYERRCIVAMKPCGAQSVKFIWTAPNEWRGPIWFSSGFVTTYDRSSAPNDNDFVSTLSIALNPGYEGPTYENVLDSGCSVGVGPGHTAQRSHAALAMLWLAGLVLVRSRQRRSRAWLAVGLVVTLTLACVGCDQGDGLITNPSGNVGAYEPAPCTNRCSLPIECRDTAWPDAGTPEEAKKAREEGTAMGAATAPGAGAAGGGTVDPNAVKSLGSITASFTTTQPAELVSDWIIKCKNMPCHYMSAWIEDDSKRYVRTVWAQKGMYLPLSLRSYFELGYDCQVPQESISPDITSAATIDTHQSYTVSWDGLLGSGHRAAAAGRYHLRIEVAIDEVHHFAVADVPFMFGDPAPYTMPFAPEPAHTGVTLTYTPTL